MNKLRISRAILEGTVYSPMVKPILRQLLIVGLFLLCSNCLSQVPSNSKENAIARQYGAIAHSRQIGDMTCYSHKTKPDDYKNSENPFVTVVLQGEVIQHGRLNELLDFLAEKESNLSRQKASFALIEIYGIGLGDDIRMHLEFEPDGVDEESRLIKYTNKENKSGWDKFNLKVDADGTIEEIDLLTTFKSSHAMQDFVTRLVTMLSDKFIPAKHDYFSSRRQGMLLISGVPDYESYIKKMKQYIYTDLAIGVQLDQSKGYIPYIINDRLAKISVFYEDDRSLVWLSVQSNRVDARIDRTNEEILKKM